jgi:lathosterol oxidase
VIGLFLLPVHYYTHVILLFFSGIWATNIHDAVVSFAVSASRLCLAYSHYMDVVCYQWADFEPIMGAKYHTVHHTHYHYNFGQVSAAVCRFYSTGYTG